MMRVAVIIVSFLSLVLGTTGAFTTTTTTTTTCSDSHHVVWSSLTRQQQPTAAAATTTTRLHVSSASSSSAQSGKRKQQQQQKINIDFLMDDFKTSNGELLNPYQILKVSRDAGKMQIKQAYRSLSRRYHPDGVRHRQILPGSCDNLQQVADHWERIKLSYEILSDSKRRKRYDRAEVLSDPGLALRRAIGRAALDGAASFGKGIFGLGAAVVQHVVTKTTTTTNTTMTVENKSNSNNSGSIAHDDGQENNN